MMKRSKRFAALILTGVMAATTLFGCGRFIAEMKPSQMQIAQRQTAH